MAYVSYDRAVHATATPSPRRLAWGRLFALAATIALWAGLIAAVRAIF